MDAGIRRGRLFSQLRMGEEEEAREGKIIHPVLYQEENVYVFVAHTDEAVRPRAQQVEIKCTTFRNHLINSLSPLFDAPSVWTRV